MKQGNIPEHVAIMMDGNGRWAKSRNKDRSFGHAEGAKTFKSIVRAADELHIKYLTVFAFSTENWKRPADEVNNLMLLLVEFILKDSKLAVKNNIRIRILGDRSRLEDKVKKCIDDIETFTKDCNGLNLQIAVNYGGRDDIVRAFQKMYLDVKENKIPYNEINATLVSSYLDTADIPEPDLFIRTGGDKRVSNFMLWQFAYTEFYFTDILWPDFTKDDLACAVNTFGKRERRFGEIHE